MTWPATGRRLLAAIGALGAVVLVVATTATPTVAGWTDGAVFAAKATSGTWATEGGDSCEVLDTTTGEVVGTCTVDGVTFSDGWAQGTRFSVAVSGFQPSNDRVARVSVDLSQYSSAWDWAAGSVQMDSAQDVEWSAPVVTFTTYPWGFSPFTGTYIQPETRTGSAPAEEPQDSAPAEEPQDSAPAEEPGDSAPAEEPGDSAPVEEPGDSAPAEEPQDSAPAEEPQDSADSSASQSARRGDAASRP
ncbi:hypothetical protein [Nocardioides pantholopis]|uniref:hypothetical protein n=1 Tax=Nocardioides pantholopis TaxID=2483798 RepID=UPI000F082EBA|nr:hypothetical protein [Nocardioides pantholopis]